MKAVNFLLILLLLLLFFITITLVHGGTCNKKHYIVYMGEHSHPSSESVIKANHEMLTSVTGSYDEAEEAVVHHYTKSFRGFSAMLTQEQAQKLRESDSVVSLFESRISRLQTTHSWEFLGLNSVYENDQIPTASSSSLTSNTIVAVLDSGIWPESESFNDEGLGPVPAKFKGGCLVGENFTSANCNRKIVGARYYYKAFEAEFGPLESAGATYFRSARDEDGHGSHTASTIAGSLVANTSVYGVARGTARGGAPHARLAIYKVCWFGQCSDGDILSAMDDAINDGADVLSLSLGPDPPEPLYFESAISIGAFHAFRRGILVSCSAGNSFFARTATNVAPWIFTIAASTIDRKFKAELYLGNSKVLKGFSLNPIKMKTSIALIAASDAAAPGVPAVNASFCKNSTDLDSTKIAGKIVVCEIENVTDSRRQKGTFVQQGGGAGIILIDPSATAYGFPFGIPGISISQKEGQQLQAYIKSQMNPTARISTATTVLKTKPAPVVALFSSRGPNVITPDIIKPDITAPGVNILAAWSPVGVSAMTGGRSLNYNVISGTSMSCPHASAIAAIVKSYHPTWSPAAIMSAIMTTATIIDNTHTLIENDPDGRLATPFDYGSGHVNPIAALDPGLIYDFNTNDIFNFLCSSSVRASPAQLKNLTGEATQCLNSAAPSYDLNYPSIGVSNLNGSLSVRRTVTYIGNGPTLYVANVENPGGIKAVVKPSKLKFTRTGEKRSFRVHFKPVKTSNGDFVFGALTWSNGVHKVRSPIAVNVMSR